MTAPRSSNWGGKREGQGRPRKYNGEKTVSYSLSLPESLVARLETLRGDLSRSEFAATILVRGLELEGHAD